MLIDAAIAWVQANCTDPKLRSDVARKLKDVMQRRVDCWFGVGPVLTRRHVPYLIHCWCSYEMTSEFPAGYSLRLDYRVGLGEDLDPASLNRICYTRQS
jgi:hypothetical protein